MIITFFIFSAEKTDLLTEDLQHVRKLSFVDMCQNVNPFLYIGHMHEMRIYMS